MLSHLMCIVVAYNYRDMLCGIRHSCCSAPTVEVRLTCSPIELFKILLGIRSRGGLTHHQRETLWTATAVEPCCALTVRLFDTNYNFRRRERVVTL